MELKKIEAETTSHPWGPKEKSSNPRSPKLPYFDEHTDKIDSYLLGSKVMPCQINGTRLCGHYT